jgi:hypothetical protein
MTFAGSRVRDVRARHWRRPGDGSRRGRFGKRPSLTRNPRSVFFVVGRDAVEPSVFNVGGAFAPRQVAAPTEHSRLPGKTRRPDRAPHKGASHFRFAQRSRSRSGRFGKRPSLRTAQRAIPTIFPPSAISA